MKSAVLSLHEDASSEEISPYADPGTYLGEAECPQCGELGDQHTKYCPHNPDPGESGGRE